jgi:hypothetical protein
MLRKWGWTRSASYRGRDGMGTSRIHAGSAAEPLSAPLDRVLRVGARIAVTAVAVQTLVHLLNAFYDWSPQLDANAEYNAMSWASSVATFAAAFAAGLHATLIGERRRTYSFLACVFAFFSLDDAILVHERISEWSVDTVGLSETWDSVIWPALYLPFAGVAVALLAALARAAPARAARFVLVGLLLLLTAVAAEVVSAPTSTSQTASGWGHALEGAYEEGAELMGWILIAAGLMVSSLSELWQPNTRPYSQQ